MKVTYRAIFDQAKLENSTLHHWVSNNWGRASGPVLVRAVNVMLN